MSVPYASMTLGELAVAYAEVWERLLRFEPGGDDREFESDARREEMLVAELRQRGVDFAPARGWWF